MNRSRILIVDDEAGMRKYLQKLLSDNGYLTDTASNGEEAIERIRDGRPDLVLLDLKMPKMNGIKVLEALGESRKTVPVVMMTAYGSMDTAIKAMKLGADDYINKPFEMDEILLSVEKVLEKKELEEENRTLHKELEKTYSFEDIISRNDKMHEMFDLIRRIASSRSSVFINGETGTGKEMIARAIHDLSNRKGLPFIPIDCGALTETLLESELFGHVKGAFTGATADKKGLFQAADDGTAFLDEVGQISPGIQAKLLRVLQDGHLKRVGESAFRTVDVRIVAATNENMELAVKEGRFREDLLYRLNVVPIMIPPLRERKEDIPLLAEHFINKYNHLEKRTLRGITKDALNILMQYDWPGNVRQLENLMHRAVAMETGNEIHPRDLPDEIMASRTGERRNREKRTNDFRGARKQAIEAFERRFLTEALQRNKGIVTRVAKEVGIDRRNLQRKFKLYGINPLEYRM